MSYEICRLANVPFKAVHHCFVRAFADYAVNVGELPESALLRRARKNGWAPELSFGATRNGSLVAVSLTGLDVIAGRPCAYDIATGIQPDHRRRGLAGRLMDAIIQSLKAREVDMLQLEVLQDNTPAIRAYEKAGFTITRALKSLQGEANAVITPNPSVHIRPVTAREVCELSDQLDFRPSFEQRDQAICHLEDDLLMLGVHEDNRCVSAIAFDPQTNWLMRLVTHSEYRRQGFASSLLGALAARLASECPVKAVNVDGNDSMTLALLKKCGLGASLSQWEMQIEL